VTMHNPFESDQGDRVRTTMMRLLAATGGAAGDFAGEVLAGRRRPSELLAHRAVLEEFVQDARGLRNLIDALPAEQRRQLATGAQAVLEQRFAELAALDVDSAVAELRDLAAPAPEPSRTRASRASRADDEDDDWGDQTYLEPL